MSECKYILIQVEAIVGRELNKQEVEAVSEMYKLGSTTRQMVTEVKRIAAYAEANKRRVAYINKMKELGTGPLSGAASIKFKAMVDKADGTSKGWEKEGYPAAYRTDILEKAAKNKKQGKKQEKAKQAAKLEKQMKKYKPSSMNEVD